MRIPSYDPQQMLDAARAFDDEVKSARRAMLDSIPIQKPARSQPEEVLQGEDETTPTTAATPATPSKAATPTSTTPTSTPDADKPEWLSKKIEEGDDDDDQLPDDEEAAAEEPEPEEEEQQG